MRYWNSYGNAIIEEVAGIRVSCFDEEMVLLRLFMWR